MKETISFEKHTEIGMMCKILDDLLVKKEIEIYNSQRNKREGAKASLHWMKAQRAIGEFRNHMEEILFIEYPDQATTGIYYGERPKDFEQPIQTP